MHVTTAARRERKEQDDECVLCVASTVKPGLISMSIKGRHHHRNHRLIVIFIMVTIDFHRLVIDHSLRHLPVAQYSRSHRLSGNRLFIRKRSTTNANVGRGAKCEAICAALVSACASLPF